MEFTGPIANTHSEAITPAGIVPAATKETLSKESTRVAVEIQASGGTVYVGGDDVSAENGLAIKDGESRVFPVVGTSSLYMTGGKAVVVDYYG